MASDPLGDSISGLNAANTLTGAEIVPLTQTTVTRRTTLQLIADWIIQTAASFVQSGSGAIAEPLQSRGQWELWVTDYMSAADRASIRAGSTVSATTAATNATTRLVALGGGTLRFPPGHFSLDTYRPYPGVVVRGAGKKATFIHQEVAGNKAYYCLADVTTGQIHGAGLLGCRVVGHASATVAAVEVAATSPYVVAWSDFDYDAQDTYSALKITTAGNQEVYTCSFKIHSSGTSSTAFITEGAYNDYFLTADSCDVGFIVDVSLSSTFYKPAADGRMTFNGQNNLILAPSVETLFLETAQDYVIGLIGNGNTTINPNVQNVAAADATASFYLGNAGNTVINPRVWGANYPNYSFDLVATPTKYTIVGGDIACTFKLYQHISAATLNAGAFVGNCSSYLGLENPQVARLRYCVVNDATTQLVANGTSTTPVAGTIYLSELRIGTTKDLTGIGVLNAATVGTDEYIVALFDSDGTFLVSSALAGVTSSGADAFQEVPFTAAFRAVPGRYWVGVQLNGTTDRFRTIAASTYVDVLTKSSAGAFGTVPDQTAPTTFTADVGPIAYVY